MEQWLKQQLDAEFVRSQMLQRNVLDQMVSQQLAVAQLRQQEAALEYQRSLMVQREVLEQTIGWQRFYKKLDDDMLEAQRRAQEISQHMPTDLISRQAPPGPGWDTHGVRPSQDHPHEFPRAGLEGRDFLEHLADGMARRERQLTGEVITQKPDNLSRQTDYVKQLADGITLEELSRPVADNPLPTSAGEQARYLLHHYNSLRDVIRDIENRLSDSLALLDGNSRQSFAERSPLFDHRNQANMAKNEYQIQQERLQESAQCNADEVRLQTEVREQIQWWLRFYKGVHDQTIDAQLRLQEDLAQLEGRKLHWQGRRHSMDTPAVQAGHRVSKHSGAPEFLAIEDADLNQLTNWTGESAGITFDKETIVIDGAIVDRASALRWSQENMRDYTKLSRKIVERAPAHPGWTPPSGFKGDIKQKFMAVQLEIIARNPHHPLRFLLHRR